MLKKLRVSGILLIPFILYAAQKLTVVHLNDTHGQIEPIEWKDGHSYGGFARVAYVVDSLRAEADEEGNDFLLLHGGDALQGPPISNTQRGKLDFELLGEIGIDAMVAGNHEFDFGQANLAGLEAEAEFPLLSANVLDAQGEALLQQYVENKIGRQRVVIVGLTTPGTPFGTHPDNVKGLAFTSPDSTMTDLIEAGNCKDKDLIIALTHQGVYYDSILAVNVEDVDLVVGGHSHTALEQPKQVNQTLIVQAGARTVYLGKLEAEVKKGEITDWNYELILLSDSLAEDGKMAARIAKEVEIVDQKLGQPIGKTELTLVPGFTDKSDERSIGDMVVELMAEETGVDFAFTNAGGVRATIIPGDVSVKDILTALPFNNTIVTMELTAQQVQELLDFNIAHGPHSGGTLHLTGIEYEVERSTAVNVRIGGEPLDSDRTYRIATNNFLAAGGDGYEMLKEGADSYDTGTVDNTLLMRYIEKVGVIK